jgi:hypothetical protein
MKHIITVTLFFLLPALLLPALLLQPVRGGELTEEMKKEGWVSIFDGKTLEGWKWNGKTEGFYVKDGCIVGKGETNHLFYIAEEFGNFEFQMDIKINPGGNSGVYIKSQWDESKWPVTGFELQVNNSHPNPLKTGSLYYCLNYLTSPHGDDEWFNYAAICKGNEVEVKVNGKTLYLYKDRKDPLPSGTKITEFNKRIAQRGYLVLQQHDPKSVPEFKNIFIRKLPD